MPKRARRFEAGEDIKPLSSKTFRAIEAELRPKVQKLAPLAAAGPVGVPAAVGRVRERLAQKPDDEKLTALLARLEDKTICSKDKALIVAQVFPDPSELIAAVDQDKLDELVRGTITLDKTLTPPARRLIEERPTVFDILCSVTRYDAAMCEKVLSVLERVRSGGIGHEAGYDELFRRVVPNAREITRDLQTEALGKVKARAREPVNFQ